MTATLTPSGQQVGWLLGDLPVDAKTRTIALTYTVPVKDLAGLDAGDTLTNSALLGWDLTDETDPTGVGGTPDKTSGPATSTVTVTEPDVTIAKAVSDQTPEPGESFTYTVTATNANTADTSTAHHVLITDVVPAGVVVDADTISDGGSIAGADPVTGGGTITWTLASLAKGAGKALTYQATLSDPAPSALLTNTAAVTSYCSIAFTTTPSGV